MTTNITTASDLDALYAALLDAEETDELRDALTDLPDFGGAPYRCETYMGGEVVATDAGRVLWLDERGYHLDRRNDVILPAGGWCWDARREEFVAVLLGAQPVTMTICHDENAETWNAVIHIEGAGGIDKSSGRTAQEAADWCAEQMAHWFREIATPGQVIGFVPDLPDGHGRQTELAEILGVSQPAARKWINGDGQMSGAARMHVARMAGVRRELGGWVL